MLIHATSSAPMPDPASSLLPLTWPLYPSTNVKKIVLSNLDGDAIWRRALQMGNFSCQAPHHHRRQRLAINKDEEGRGCKLLDVRIVC